MEKNSIEVLTHFIRELKVPVSRGKVISELQKHPHPNSLLAMSDILNYLKVPNISYKVTSAQLNKLSTPFVAFLKNNEFVIVHELNDSNIILSNDHLDRKVVTRGYLDSQMQGYVLLAEKSAESGDKNYKINFRNEIIENWQLPVTALIATFIACISIISFSNFLQYISLRIIALTFLKTIGIIVSMLLLSYSLYSNNTLLKKICSLNTDKSCNKILSSPAAKITNQLSWSEIGFFYFFGSWLALIGNAGHIKVLGFLAILNICSLPYTFYSIYYQTRIAKQWCLLCTTVQILLWLEFFTFLPYLKFDNILPPTNELRNLVICFITPILFWILLKPYFIQKKLLHSLKEELRKIKFNKNIFQRLLADEVKQSLLPDESSITFGSQTASNVITLVANPYCEPCSIAHRKLEEWAERFDNIKVQIVFVTREDIEDYGNKVVSLLMAVKLQGDRDINRTLSEWSELKFNYHLWSKKQEVQNSPYKSKVECILKEQRDWCKVAGITHTPTIFINGLKIPTQYRIDDLRYLI